MSSLKWDGDKAKANAERGGSSGVQSAAEMLLQRTLPNTPKRSGELRGSGRVAGAGLEASVAFTAPHAIAVHERTDVRHAVGQAKFLERTLADEQRALLKALAAELHNALS